MVKLIKIYDYSRMIDLYQLQKILTRFRVFAIRIAESILEELKNQKRINLVLLCLRLEKHPDYRLPTGPVMSFIEHFTIERLMKLAQFESQSHEVISFMHDVKYNYVQLLDVVNAYSSEERITDKNEKERIHSEFYQREINRLDAEIHYQLGNSRTASDRLKILKLSLEKHYLNKNFLQEKVSSNKKFLKGLRKRMNEALKELERLKTLITSSPDKLEIDSLKEKIKRLEKILSEQSSDNYKSIVLEKQKVLYLNLLKRLLDEMKNVSYKNGISFRQESIILRLVRTHGFKQSLVLSVIEMFGWDKFENLNCRPEIINEFLLSAMHNFSLENHDWLVSVVAEELRAKISESQLRLNELLKTMSAQNLEELERRIQEQKTAFSLLEEEYNIELSKENSISIYAGSNFEINQLKWLIPKYIIAFLKDPLLENMKTIDVIKSLWKPKKIRLPVSPPKQVAPEPMVCEHSCSIEQLTEAIMWLSSGLGGMFKKLDPSLFIFLLTSTFDSHKCGYFNVSERLFNEVIKSNVLKGGIVGPQADCEAHVCHDRLGCLSCLCAKTITSFQKHGPNCTSITRRDPASSFMKTGLHCLVNDDAIKSLLVSISTLDSYSLFCFILYLCQQMDYFDSNIARDRKVQIDPKKIADVKYFISLLVQHHLPTNPCLSVLVERYKIPTIVENPIPLTEIALAFSARSGITIEGASERILATKQEYFSDEEVFRRFESTENRLTRWCKANA
jgi:hypothetical protein